MSIWGGVLQISLSENASVWADEILKTDTTAREARSERNKAVMQMKGFDVGANASKLEQIYMS